MTLETAIEPDIREGDAIIVFHIEDWSAEELNEAALCWDLNNRELAKIWGEMKRRQWQRELAIALNRHNHDQEEL